LKYLVKFQSNGSERLVHVSDILRRFKPRPLPNLAPFLEALREEDKEQTKELVKEADILRMQNLRYGNENEVDPTEEFLGEEDGWDFTCYKCGEPGEIIVCDGRYLNEDPYSTEKPCSRSCHLECAELFLEPDEEEPWYCEDCAKLAKKKVLDTEKQKEVEMEEKETPASTVMEKPQANDAEGKKLEEKLIVKFGNKTNAVRPKREIKKPKRFADMVCLGKLKEKQNHED